MATTPISPGGIGTGTKVKEDAPVTLDNIAAEKVRSELSLSVGNLIDLLQKQDLKLTKETGKGEVITKLLTLKVQLDSKEKSDIKKEVEDLKTTIEELNRDAPSLKDKKEFTDLFTKITKDTAALAPSPGFSVNVAPGAAPASTATSTVAEASTATTQSNAATLRGVGTAPRPGVGVQPGDTPGTPRVAAAAPGAPAASVKPIDETVKLSAKGEDDKKKEEPAEDAFKKASWYAAFYKAFGGSGKNPVLEAIVKPIIGAIQAAVGVAETVVGQGLVLAGLVTPIPYLREGMINAGSALTDYGRTNVEAGLTDLTTGLAEMASGIATGVNMLSGGSLGKGIGHLSDIRKSAREAEAAAKEKADAEKQAEEAKKEKEAEDKVGLETVNPLYTGKGAEEELAVAVKNVAVNSAQLTQQSEVNRTMTTDFDAKKAKADPLRPSATEQAKTEKKAPEQQDALTVDANRPAAPGRRHSE